MNNVSPVKNNDLVRRQVPLHSKRAHIEDVYGRKEEPENLLYQNHHISRVDLERHASSSHRGTLQPSHHDAIGGGASDLEKRFENFSVQQQQNRY